MYKQLYTKAAPKALPSKGPSALLTGSLISSGQRLSAKGVPGNNAIPLLSTRAMLHHSATGSSSAGGLRTPLLASLSTLRQANQHKSATQLGQFGLKSMVGSQARWFSMTRANNKDQQLSASSSGKKKLVSEAILAEVPLVDVKKVLVVGSGGLTIGQAGEFDYS
ncbi:hypothetical protein BGX24_005149, partial [Mortierella sp. AD032]